VSNYDDLIRQSAHRYNLDPDVFRRLLIRESGLNPNAINHKSGAAGIAQFMPATAQGLGIDPMNPAQAIPASAQYLRQNLNHFGDYDHALAAYNWGPGNLARHGLENAPPETRNYIAAIKNGGGPLSADGGGGGPLPVPPIPPPGGAPPLPAADGSMVPVEDTQGASLADAIAMTAKRAQGFA
jgi:hypothetical protein